MTTTEGSMLPAELSQALDSLTADPIKLAETVNEFLANPDSVESLRSTLPAGISAGVIRAMLCRASASALQAQASRLYRRADREEAIDSIYRQHDTTGREVQAEELRASLPKLTTKVDDAHKAVNKAVVAREAAREALRKAVGNEKNLRRFGTAEQQTDALVRLHAAEEVYRRFQDHENTAREAASAAEAARDQAFRDIEAVEADIERSRGFVTAADEITDYPRSITTLTADYAHVVHADDLTDGERALLATLTEAYATKLGVIEDVRKSTAHRVRAEMEEKFRDQQRHAVNWGTGMNGSTR